MKYEWNIHGLVQVEFLQSEKISQKKHPLAGFSQFLSPKKQFLLVTSPMFDGYIPHSDGYNIYIYIYYIYMYIIYIIYIIYYIYILYT